MFFHQERVQCLKLPSWQQNKENYIGKTFLKKHNEKRNQG